MSLYEIVFEGQVQTGAPLEAVKANLARVFQADTARIEALFSGRRLVLKTGLDAAEAGKYRQVLERAGAAVQVNALAEPAIEPGLPSAEAPRPRAEVVPRDQYMAAFAHVDAPAYDLAELGADLSPPTAPAPAPAMDLSGLSLAPAGSDMGQAKPQAASAAPNTDHLRLIP
ncbi:hypothetical protein [Pseudomonas typographi]|uniref:Uncharacterized protein n=1 Tax=Pseudomonas typographi TaxID=2715964 RepID=A0ABR7Z8D9_9PSED|nr:hypothetical protein [Pseudomonas typographi]MBD1554210.1 hypothetical protein [Pseudomonas typographi]MBD1586684.1 hypothetical protein [Pseudomonas typographi]MBD1601680.1 hypothetical protein [Pseudomonas typographi]